MTEQITYCASRSRKYHENVFNTSWGDLSKLHNTDHLWENWNEKITQYKSNHFGTEVWWTTDRQNCYINIMSVFINKCWYEMIKSAEHKYCTLVRT